jgi:hypothetical protein
MLRSFGKDWKRGNFLEKAREAAARFLIGAFGERMYVSP